MNNVSRICPQCGASTSMEARHCPQCGYDTQTGLSSQQNDQLNLPMVIGKAALPILVGAAGLMLRVGWQLMRSTLVQDALRYGARKATHSLVNVTKNAGVKVTSDPAALTPAPSAQPPMKPPPVEVASAKGKRTIRIRSSWAVGDSNGVRQQGTSDHTIEIHD